MKRYVAAAAAASGQPIPPPGTRAEAEGARASTRCGAGAVADTILHYCRRRRRFGGGVERCVGLPYCFSSFVKTLIGPIHLNDDSVRRILQART